LNHSKADWGGRGTCLTTTGILDRFAVILFGTIAILAIIAYNTVMQQTMIQFPNGNTLVLHSMSVALLYSIAYNAIIVDQKGQLLLDFSV
jgi:hypothetical protein